jgi:hypothetical protein
LERGAYGSAEFDEAITLLESAAGSGNSDAQFLLGHICAQIRRLPRSAERAAHWLGKAAASGHPEAQSRLADLYLIGRGVPQDDATALHWATRAARQLYQPYQCDLAYMLDEGLGARRDSEQATTWYLRALAQGSHRAAFAMGLRLVSGATEQPDPVAAAACLHCATGGDYPEAAAWLARLEGELTDTERARARELAEAIRSRVRGLAAALAQAGVSAAATTPEELKRFGDFVDSHFDALGVAALAIDPAHRHAAKAAGAHRSLTNGSGTGVPEALLWRPRVFGVRRFVSEIERAHLLATAGPRMDTAGRFGADAAAFEQGFFSGLAARLGDAVSDPVYRSVERRVACTTQLPVAHIEPLSVLKYRAGDDYAPHVDYLTPERLAGAHGGQRLVTFICYLKAPAEGGETEYLKADYRVTGEDGLALIHHNCLPDGAPDEASLHASRPIVAGEKWLLRTAIHERSLHD